MKHTHTFLLLSPLFFVSCSNVQNVEFHVFAKNTQERDVPCRILLNKKVLLDAETKAPLITPQQIIVPFRLKADGTGYQVNSLGVQPGKQTPEGKIIYDLPEGEKPDYTSEPRIILPNDAGVQLFFVLRRRSEG
ncbi:MAG TPA: hypothetical protein VMT52_03080 [Planctomycetota bacterium]|nr:hypothetical protein [Planctomycetota bacterium]